MDNQLMGELLCDALSWSGATTVATKRVKANAGGIVQMLLEEEPLEKLTSEDCVRTISNLLDREHDYYLNAKKAVESDKRHINSALRQAESVREYVDGWRREANSTLTELRKLLEQYELLKREPNAETSSINARPAHFTCRLCGCSMGKIQPNARSEWIWMKPKFCPMCGGKVVAESAMREAE